MNERRWERFGAEAGIAFIVLGVIGIIVQGEAPGQNATGSEITSWLADNRDGLLLSSLMWSLASIFGLFFVATLRARLSEAEGGHNELATAAALGGLAMFVANWAGGAMLAAVAFREGAGLDPGIVRMAVDMSNFGLTLAGVGTAVVAGSVAAVVLSTGLLPKWVGWAGVAAAALGVVSLFSIVFDDGFMAPGQGFAMMSSAAGLLFMLALAVEFLRYAEAPAPVGKTAATTA